MLSAIGCLDISVGGFKDHGNVRTLNEMMQRVLNLFKWLKIDNQSEGILLTGIQTPTSRG